MADRRGRLNVVITRGDSLSPRSRSGSASPSRNNHPVEERISEQMNYQDVVLLHRKWRDAKRNAAALQKELAVLTGCLNTAGAEAMTPKENASTTTAQTELNCKELQERTKAVKQLLDKSRLKSAKLSRLVVAKSRELKDTRKEAARVPELTATVDRLRNAKCAAQKAHGEEVRRVEEEQRRSKAWRAQVDKVSLQAVQNAESCRVISSENGGLRKELAYVKALLKEAERRRAVASTISEELRLKSIEVGLLTEELGAVRQDCGRLVQLISSTKEYSQFRRLWDDSGSLTRLNNARSTSSCCARVASSCCAATRGGDGGSGAAVGAATAPPFGTDGTIQLQGGAAGANTSMTACWRQALRSEWASPSETIIDAVTTPSIPVGATLATVVAAPVDEEKGSRREEGEETMDLQGAGVRPRAGAETEGAGTSSSRRVSFSQYRRYDLLSEKLEARGTVQVSEGRGETEKRERGCAVPSMDADADSGVGDSPAETAAVRWGRMDLLSVLYPPLAAGEGSGADIDVGAEASMWVPQEAAELCRRFVRDFDGYSGVPLDLEQHRLLRSLLLGLNRSWRQSERKHIERLTKRYRAELKTAHRRLDMRKPTVAVLAERAAERRQSSPAPFCSGANGVSVAKTGGSSARSPRWGANGRRIPGRELSQARCDGACTECHQSCIASGGKRGSRKTAEGRVMRSSANDRGGRKTAVGRRQRPKVGRAAPTTSAASDAACIAVSVPANATTFEGQEATESSTSNGGGARLSEILDEYDYPQGEINSSGRTREEHGSRRCQPGATVSEEAGGSDCREGGGALVTDGKGAWYDLGQHVLNKTFFTGRARSTTPVAYHTQARVCCTPVPPPPPTSA